MYHICGHCTLDEWLTVSSDVLYRKPGIALVFDGLVIKEQRVPAWYDIAMMVATNRFYHRSGGVTSVVDAELSAAALTAARNINTGEVQTHTLEDKRILITPTVQLPHIQTALCSWYSVTAGDTGKTTYYTLKSSLQSSVFKLVEGTLPAKSYCLF